MSSSWKLEHSHDEPCSWIDLPDQAAERRALVAARQRGDARAVNRWAVSSVVVVLPFVPVTPIDRVRQVARRQLDLADDGDTRGSCRGDGSASPGTPGLLTTRSTPGTPRRTVRRPRRPQPRARAQPTGGGVDRDHLVSLPRQQERGRASRPASPTTRTRLTSCRSRKNSVNPVAARSAATSQNRTMIFVSLHAAISKWWWIGVIRNTRRRNFLNTMTCTMTDSASITKMPPMTIEQDLGLRHDRHRRDRPAQGVRPGVAHEHARRERVEPQEPEARADQRRAEDRQVALAADRAVLGLARHERHAGVREHRDPARPGGEPVEAVREVDGVREAADDQEDDDEEHVPTRPRTTRSRSGCGGSSRNR